MNDYRVFRILFALAFCIVVGVGEVTAQYLECNTVAAAPDSLQLGGTPPQAGGVSMPEVFPEPYYLKIRCYIHVIQETSGVGGLSQTQIDDMISTVDSDYDAINITMEIVGQDTVANSLYFSDPDNYASDLFSENPHTDAIDIYLGPSTGTAKGRADGIPSSAMVITGNLSSYSALSHILGNCLGLYETDETLFGIENPNGSNSQIAGDLIDDTAADLGLVGWVDGNCSLSVAFQDSFPNYSPDVTNIMSNAPLDCWSTFSTGQGQRISDSLEYFSVLRGVAVSFPPGGVFHSYSNETQMDLSIGQIDRRTNAVAFSEIDCFSTGKECLSFSMFYSPR